MVRREQPPELSEEARRLALALREVRRATSSQRFREAVYGAGEALDIAQHDALEVIVTSEGARMGELADALRVDRSTATRVVAKLEDLGLVSRGPDPSDGRSVVALATPAGLARHQELRHAARAALSRVYGDFEVGELVQAADLLERLVASMDALVEHALAASR